VLAALLPLGNTVALQRCTQPSNPSLQFIACNDCDAAIKKGLSFSPLGGSITGVGVLSQVSKKDTREKPFVLLLEFKSLSLPLTRPTE
jgi:hypothetical protein